MSMEWTRCFRKALTLSYDDGIESDVRLVELLNRYGVKCTFNLNSGLGSDSCWDYKGFQVRRLDLPDAALLYKGHEIAVHGRTHAAPSQLAPDELYAEFSEDIRALTRLFGTKPVGMAYPYGDYNDAVVETLCGLGLQYGRTVEPSHDFAVQSDLMRFRPTCHHEDEMLPTLIEQFLAYDGDAPAIFCLWGHSYEFDGSRNWDAFERTLERLAGRDDVFYGTNAQVLL